MFLDKYIFFKILQICLQVIHGKSNCLAANGLNLYNNHKNILEELTYGVVSK